MSVPLAPKKSCYAQLQDNRKGAKNNNESLLGLGDRNANPIMVEVSPSRDESEPCDLTDGIGNANLHEPGNTRFHKEFHQLQSVEKESQAAPASLKDLQFSSAACGELNEEHTAQRGTARPQTLHSVPGPSLASWRNVMGEASPDVLAKRGAELPRHAPKDKLAKTLDNEELRRHALQRVSGPSAAVVECTGSLTWQLQPPDALDSVGAPGPVTWVGAGPWKTVTAHAPGPAVPPADSTSEGETLRHPKPSTSETRETSCLETQMEVGHRREGSDHHAPRSAHLEQAPALKEVPREPDTRPRQGKSEQLLGLTLVQSWAGHDLTSAQTQCLGCPEDDSGLPLERKGPGGEAQQEAAPLALSSAPPGSPHLRGVGGGGSEQDMSAIHLREQGMSPVHLREQDTSTLHLREQGTSAVHLCEQGMSAVHLHEQGTSAVHLREQDMSSVHLREQSTSAVHLHEQGTSAVHLREQDMSSVHLREQSTSAVHLHEQDTSAVHLREQSMSAVHLREQDMSAVHLHEQDMSSVHLREQSTSAVHLHEQDTSAVHLREQSTSAVHLREQDMSSVHLREQSTSAVHLREQDMSAVHLREQDMSSVYLREQGTSTVHLCEQDMSAMHLREQSTSTVHLREQSTSAVHLREQGTSAVHLREQGPAPGGAVGSPAPGGISPGAASTLGDSPSSSISPGDGHVAFIPDDPTDSRPSDTGQERANGDRARLFTSDPSIAQSKTRAPELLDPQSSSSEAGQSQEGPTSVAEHRNLLENAVETELAPTRTDSLPSVPAPLLPETTVNMTPQPTPPRTSFQGVSMLRVGTGSPLVAPPPADSVWLWNACLKVPDKNVCPGGIPKAVPTHPQDVPSSREGLEDHQVDKTAERTEPKPVILPKPKHVRPKIITYIRRSPQTLGQVDPSLVPVGLPFAPPTCDMPLPKEEKAAGGDLKPAANLYEKFKPDLQKPRVFSPGLMVSGLRPPGHHFSQMSEKFLQEVTERPGKEEFCSAPYAHYEVPPTFYRSAMLLKPQLGLGAMSRLPSAKSRILIASQRSSASALHPPGPIATAASLYSSDPADLKKASGSNAAKSSLPKSGLRPPGYSRLPAAKLAAFGFVRSSSVSSVPSTQSVDSVPESSRPANRSAFGSEDQPALKAAAPSKDAPRGSSRVAPPPASSVTTPRRSLLPAPKSTSIPAGTKKEAQKDQDANKPAVSSPKRMAASTSKLHSPGYPKQRSTVPRNGSGPKPDLQAREAERQLVQRLKERSERQARQLGAVQAELRRALRGFQALAVVTQHFFRKNESALVKEKELCIELAHIRDEVAFNTARCEKVQKEKEALERRFEDELSRLGCQQQAELRGLQERLQLQFQAEVVRLQEEHGAQLLRMRCQHQEQVEDLTASHEAALLEMESNHTVAIAILQGDHDHQVQELISTHELEKKELEENFEKLRLSLQDQVDTLTFQSRALRDRARRFEKALRKSTEEQLEVARAPYQHLEEDMESLKQVLEMKNQQIHQQEKKILELEKLAEKNSILEEKIQVLQQRNEDLKARIDQNTVVTRQLSEENANLQEYVEKETKEKKRLSRTNEELLWKLQTGDPTSPIKLSPTSPIYRGSSSGPSSPAKVSTTPR